jgi:hypothetical protein
LPRVILLRFALYAGVEVDMAILTRRIERIAGGE